MRVRTEFTDRLGGLSAPPYDHRNLGGAVGDDPVAVAGNRARTATAFGLDPQRVVFMRQVHGAKVVRAGEPADDVDAVHTTEPGLALAALVADCAPVLMGDAQAGIVGAAHSGRPGTQKGVVLALVRAMIEQGGRPDRMTAVIGPMVCGLCYEVPEGMRDEVAAAVPESWSRTRAGTPGLDLRRGITGQLERAGVGEIHHDTRCTMESPELYSYRRDGRTGRFAGYVWLEP